MSFIPSNYTFVCSYYSTINAERGGGALTGTATGGATVVDHKLDLAHNDIRFVEYTGTGNANNPQTGAFKFKYTPNYTGTPATASQTMVCAVKANAVLDNRLLLLHATGTGELTASASTSAGSTITINTFGVWAPTSGQEYEMELNYNFTNGIVDMFIDGYFFAHRTGCIGTRDTNIAVLRAGCGISSGAATATNFKMKDLIIFSTVQHTTSYTPGYTLGWALEDTPNKCIVYGFIKDITNAGITGMTVRVTAGDMFIYDNLQVYETTTNVDSDSENTGYWQLDLIENTTTSIPYTFSFYDTSNRLIKTYENITIPDTVSTVEFVTLIP